jgi:hypothetical protein
MTDQAESFYYREGYECAEDNPEVQGTDKLFLIRDTYKVIRLLRGERAKLETYHDFLKGFAQAHKDMAVQHAKEDKS